MFFFFLKLTLTPLMIAMVTLTARRWGPVVSGLLVGLPLTSGPISVFLALEQGKTFAAESAHSSLFGAIAVVFFCIAYARSAEKFSWPVAATFGLSSFFLSVWLFSGLALPLLLSAALTFCTVAAGFFAVKKSTAAFTNIMAPRWDLPFRMLTATTLVLLLTMLSERLGPRWVGLLSTFPVFITVMSIFSHALYGLSEVNRFERGVIAGSFSYIIFFLLVALLLPTCNMLLVYLGASLAAVALNFSLLQLLTRVKAA